jgi:hypothetical protein
LGEAHFRHISLRICKPRGEQILQRPQLRQEGQGRAATARKKKKAGKKGKTVVKNTPKATVKNMSKGGEVRQEIARGCGAVLQNRRKVTKYL